MRPHRGAVFRAARVPAVEAPGWTSGLGADSGGEATFYETVRMLCLLFEKGGTEAERPKKDPDCDVWLK